MISLMPEGAAADSTFIGLLDIFGFEFFGTDNSFEQARPPRGRRAAAASSAAMSASSAATSPASARHAAGPTSWCGAIASASGRRAGAHAP